MTADEWRHRAHAEAHAILAGIGVARSVAFDDLVTLMSVAWLQGVDLGAHETLNEAEVAFERLRDELSA